jgi:predicted DsbA family dithiol-disulfide isomerase
MVRITEFTDPGCPFAFSAEPALLRLRWMFGDQLDWTTRMVVLSVEPDEYAAKGIDTARLAAGNKMLQEKYGMPIDSTEKPRLWATEPACRAYVAARVHQPDAADAVLRALRVRNFAGELLDDEETITASARDAGIDPKHLRGWRADEAVTAALNEDRIAARRPSAASLAMPHKLASTGEGDGMRYTCPSVEFLADDGRRVDAPGFQPFEVYDAAMANVGAELTRRPAPESVDELLAWAPYPLATVEVAAVMGIDESEARERLAKVAAFTPTGADGYWSLDAADEQLAA